MITHHGLVICYFTRESTTDHASPKHHLLQIIAAPLYCHSQSLAPILGKNRPALHYIPFFFCTAGRCFRMDSKEPDQVLRRHRHTGALQLHGCCSGYTDMMTMESGAGEHVPTSPTKQTTNKPERCTVDMVHTPL